MCIIRNAHTVLTWSPLDLRFPRWDWVHAWMLLYILRFDESSSCCRMHISMDAAVIVKMFKGDQYISAASAYSGEFLNECSSKCISEWLFHLPTHACVSCWVCMPYDLQQILDHQVGPSRNQHLAQKYQRRSWVPIPWPLPLGILRLRNLLGQRLEEISHT